MSWQYNKGKKRRKARATGQKHKMEALDNLQAYNRMRRHHYDEPINLEAELLHNKDPRLLEAWQFVAATYVPPKEELVAGKRRIVAELKDIAKVIPSASGATRLCSYENSIPCICPEFNSCEDGCPVWECAHIKDLTWSDITRKK